MRRLSKILGVLMVVGGAVWILQGLNVAFAPESFMTGNSRWVAYGTGTVFAGVGLVMLGFRASRDQ